MTVTTLENDGTTWELVLALLWLLFALGLYVGGQNPVLGFGTIAWVSVGFIAVGLIDEVFYKVVGITGWANILSATGATAITVLFMALNAQALGMTAFLARF